MTLVPRHTRRPLVAACAALAAAGLAVLAITTTAAGAADESTGPSATPTDSVSATASAGASATTTTSADPSSTDTTSAGPTADPDRTPPVIVASVVGNQGFGGWYIGDVRITWSVTDAESTITDTTGCDSVLVSRGAVARIITCTATSAGGTDDATEVINLDVTPPTIVCSVGEQRIQGSTASLVASVVDGESGPAQPTVSEPMPTEVLGVVSVTFHASDIAGNTASATCDAEVIPDTSAPIIGEPVIDGPLGDNGWFNGDVTVSFAVSEPDSTLLSVVGCGPEAVTADSTGTVITCTAISNGGTSSRTATVARDATGPAITCPVAPSIVEGSTRSLTAAVSDEVSGPQVLSVSGPLPSRFLGPGAIALSGLDLAGNSTTVECDYLVVPDATPPAIVASLSGQVGPIALTVGPAQAPGPSPWFISPVSVSFSVTEAESVLLSQSGCGTTIVDTDTTGQIVTCTATSYGGQFTRSVVVALDTTPPVVTCAVMPVYVQGSQGTVTATFSDATSGPSALGTTLDVDTTVLGPNSLVITTRDAAGNIGSSTCPYRVIPDGTPPIIIPTIDGTTLAPGWYTGPVTVSFAISDPNSPVTDVQGCDTVTVNADVIAQVVAVCRATSFGGTSVQPVTISRDSVAPVLTCLSLRFVQGAAGKATANAKDATSGVTSELVSQPADTSTPGTRAVTLTSTDRAGNTSSTRCTYEIVEPRTVSATKLSSTGSDLTPMVLGGILLALAGALLAITARRRAHADSRHRS